MLERLPGSPSSAHRVLRVTLNVDVILAASYYDHRHYCRRRRPGSPLRLIDPARSGKAGVAESVIVVVSSIECK